MGGRIEGQVEWRSATVSILKIHMHGCMHAYAVMAGYGPCCRFLSYRFISRHILSLTGRLHTFATSGLGCRVYQHVLIAGGPLYVSRPPPSLQPAEVGWPPSLSRVTDWMGKGKGVCRTCVTGIERPSIPRPVCLRFIIAAKGWSGLRGGGGKGAAMYAGKGKRRQTTRHKRDGRASRKGFHSSRQRGTAVPHTAGPLAPHVRKLRAHRKRPAPSGAFYRSQQTIHKTHALLHLPHVPSVHFASL